MEYPWEVVGYEEIISEKTQKPGIRLYAQRAVQPGANREGYETQRFFFRPEYVKYQPVVGHLIIVTEGRYGIDRIFVVGGAA